MAKCEIGNQFVEVATDKAEAWKSDLGVWKFCQNGWQSTCVKISVEQFDMMKEMIFDPQVVEYYESLRKQAQGDE